MSLDNPPTMEEVNLNQDDEDLFSSALGVPAAKAQNSAHTFGATLPSNQTAIQGQNNNAQPQLYTNASLPTNDAAGKSHISDSPSAAIGEGAAASASGDAAASSAAAMGSLVAGLGALKAAGASTEDARGEEEDVLTDLLDVVVSEPQRAGEGISSYVTYGVKTKTSMALFRKKDLAVRRRFSDFLGLYEKLAAKHLIEGRFIPSAPEKSIIGMTQIKMSKEDMSNMEFVERRRQSLQRFLRHLVVHPVFRVDPDVREFLELEQDLPKASQTSAFSATSMLKIFTKTVDSIGKFGFQMPESDQWFKDKTEYLEKFLSSITQLHNGFETLVQNRRIIAGETELLQKALALLSASEENASMARALSRLSELHLDQLYGVRANQEFYELSEEIRDFVLFVGQIKEAFNERVKAWKAWKDAEANLEKKREAKVRLELAHRMDKVPAAEQEIKACETKVENEHARFDRISANIKKEYVWFERLFLREFKRAVIASIESFILVEEKIQAAWEQFLVDARQIQ